MKTKLILGLLTTTLTAACGGGGGGSDDDPATGGQAGGGPPSGIVYNNIDDTDGGTVALSGALLALDGSTVSLSAASGEIDLSSQSFTANGNTGDIDSSSGLLSGAEYDFATDVSIGGSTFGVIGIATDVQDIRESGSITYTGEFGGQIIQSGITDDLEDWDATLTANFNDDGTVDATFEGDGSNLIDEIEITGATIDGNTFSGGTLSTSGNAGDNVTGTDVDFEGGFFGYNTALDAPAEAGGAIVSADDDTLLYGAFIVDTD